MRKKLVYVDDSSSKGLEKKKRLSIINEVMLLLSVKKVKRAFLLGSEVFAAASPFLEKPTWWNAGKAAINIGKAFVDDIDVWGDDYFSGDDWTELYNRDFNKLLVQILQKYPYENVKTADDQIYSVRLIDLPGGLRAGWTYNTKCGAVNQIYVMSKQLEQARAFMKAQLWELFDGKSLIIRQNKSLVMHEDESRVVFENDDMFETKDCKKTAEYADYLKRPLKEGVSRSVMFYGPPGTGKSTMARTIVDIMGLRSFRIQISDLAAMENSTLFEALNIFSPDAVILDDFDRACRQADLLETLEHFKQVVKLVIITVNDKKKLDDALLRPGRIDELILVDKMDEGVVKHVLGKYADGFEIVKDWPIAFINEYVIRRRYLSAVDAAESVKELTRRVADLSRYKQVDDINKMIGIVNNSDSPSYVEEDDSPL